MDDKNVRKNLRQAKILSLIEGICFFVAGICALLAENLLGYIGGGLLTILGCMGLFPVFIAGDEFFLGMGISLASDQTTNEYGEMLDRMKEEKNK